MDIEEFRVEFLFTYGVVERIRRMLSSHAFTELIISQPSRFEKDAITRLQITTSDLCAALQAVYQKIHGTKNWESWMGKMALYIIRRCAYGIEDLLDAATTNYLKRRPDDSISMGDYRLLSLQSSELSFRLSILRHQLPDILDLDDSDVRNRKEVIQFDPPPLLPPASLLDTTQGTVSSSYYDRLWPWEDTIVGGRSAKEKIIKFIFSPSDQVHPNILSVCGDSGVGKTTLAKLVCSDARVSTSFGLVIWASRIETCEDLRRIIVELIRSRTWVYPRKLDIASLKGRLRGILQGQKYLMVLDDFQLHKPSEWEELRELLGVGSTGSTVILMNTRMQSTPFALKSFKLEGLPESESWSLFTRCAAFDADAEQRYPSLERIGRRIVERCSGNPLAVKILGSTLHSNRDEHTWRQITESRLWHTRDVVKAALTIGLGKMPYDLMHCFCGYACLRDRVMSRDQLVYFWMAQGLLPSSELNDEDLRGIGDTCCAQLLSRGFLELYQQSDSPHNATFQTHNQVQLFALRELVYDLERVPTEFPVVLDGRNLQWGGGQIPSDQEFRWNRLSTFKAISFSFKHYVGPVTKRFLEGLISALSNVRVLFLDRSEFEELPESIGNLNLLRYLSLAGNHRLRVIPDSIGKLVNLQTLDLSGCEKLKKFPTYMHTAVSLRHLLLSVELTSLPAQALESWMTPLRHFKICNCQDLESLPEEIAQLTALRVLHIHDCPSIASLPNNIKCLSNLEELSIQNCQALDLTGWDGLVGLRGLRFLQFQGIPKLSKFPEAIGDLLRHLLVRNCVNLRDLPACLHKCNNLLELVIDGCPNIATLPTGIQQVKSLQVLKIVNCPELVGRCERERGQDWHLISHIPNIQIFNQVIQNRGALDSVPYGSEIEGKGGDLMSLSHEGLLDKQEVGEVQSPYMDPFLRKLFEDVHLLKLYMDLSSLEELQNAVVEMVRDRDRDTTFTPPPPPPPPPSFHQNSGPLSGCRILRNDGFDSQGDKKLGDPKQEIDVEKEAAGNEYSEFKKTHEDQLADLIVPSNELESFSKGILFLLGEGYRFEKEKLILIWMAGGFILDEPMEINGAIYFEKLMSENHILLSDSNSMYKVNTEKVNSDLGMIQDKSKYLILEGTSQHNAEPEDILHVSVACDDINDAILKTLDKLKNLRTLLFHGSCGSRLEQVLDLFLSFKSLSILDLSGTDIKEFPSSVGKMVHLKYLDLSWTLIEFLPESMSCLQRLQTLKLKSCSRLRRLPRDMKMLTELRHLDFNILGQLTSMPKGLGALIKLQTLSAFLVGTREGFNIRELRELNNLTGEFCIARLENVKSVDDAKWASITTKKCLKKLDLRWSDFPLRDLKNEVVDDIVLKNLRPHSDLEELQIRCYAGTNLPSWIADESFHKLARITLFKCEHLSILPSLQKLPSLECLELISLNSVVKVDVRGEIGHVAFPKLQNLIIDEMLNLESLTEVEEGDFPYLVELTIKDCPKLSELPSLINLPYMKRLEISNCPQVQLLSDKKLSTSLEFLIVEDCPFIKESCLEQGVQEWEMIKHVPNVWIDQEAIFEQTDDNSDVLGADDDRNYGIETEDDDGTEDCWNSDGNLSFTTL